MDQEIYTIPRHARSLDSFTLIEILAVISVILILAGVTSQIIGYANNKAIRDKTTTELKFIELQLERFKNEYGDYPTNQYSLTNNLYHMLGQTNDYVSKPIAQFKSSQYSSSGALLDPYGQLYGYQCPGSNNISGFDLWSTAGSGSPVSTVNQSIYTNAVGSANPTGIATWIFNWKR